MRTRVTRIVMAAAGACALASPFLAGSAMASAAGSASHPGLAIVRGSAPTWARTARVVGAPAATARISFEVALPLRNEARAMQLVRAVSTKTSSQYGRYLTPRQFDARFGPTKVQVAKVESFLRSRGIRVSGVAAGNRWVSASASVRRIEAVFRTSLKTYSYKGYKLREATRNLSVPASLGGLVDGILGVSQGISVSSAVKPVAESASNPSATMPTPSTCSSYWNQNQQVGPAAYGQTTFPTVGCGYSPQELRQAYGISGVEQAGDTGRGVTVAILDAYDSPTDLADANAFSDYRGIPEFKAGQFVDDSAPSSSFYDQDLCGDWTAEQSLDTQTVHGIAPGAKVVYVGAPSCNDNDLTAAANEVVQEHLASIVSNSYGDLGEQGLGDETTVNHSIYLQGALEGIGFYYSTGDYGDLTAIGDPEAEASYPSTDSLVTAVGGTTLAVNKNNSYKFETAWGDTIDPVSFAGATPAYSLPLPGEFYFGTGGGTSRLFTQPFYQRFTVPKSLSEQYGSTPMRVVPDVSALADPETGYVICIDAPDSGGTCSTSAGDLYQYGGTSLACPLFAAIQAVASQGRLFPIGFANPLLYALPSAAFHDVNWPNNVPIDFITPSGHTLLVMNTDTSLADGKGFDDATGRGTPDGLAFLLGERF
jgi:subtilase family serine protease